MIYYWIQDLASTNESHDAASRKRRTRHWKMSKMNPFTWNFAEHREANSRGNSLPLRSDCQGLLERSGLGEASAESIHLCTARSRRAPDNAIMILLQWCWGQDGPEHRRECKFPIGYRNGRWMAMNPTIGPHCGIQLGNIPPRQLTTSPACDLSSSRCWNVVRSPHGRDLMNEVTCSKGNRHSLMYSYML